MDEKKKQLLSVERVVILQGFVESYLRVTEKKSFAEAYPNEKDEYGVLNEKQVDLLHDYLARQYKGYGLDLDKIIAEKGEKPLQGSKITDFELKELIRLADEVIVLLGAIESRKQRLLKK